MNKTTTIAVCLAMLMIGFAYLAASSNDSAGEETFPNHVMDVSDVENLGSYTFMGTEYKVIRDADTNDYGDSEAIGTDIIVDSAGIKEKCFQDSGIRSVLLTNRVASIGADAFKDSTHLESVTRYGTSQISIGSGAFAGCGSLKFADLRGNNVVDPNAFDDTCSATIAVDSNTTDRLTSSCSMLRIDATSEGFNSLTYKNGNILLPYTGQGLLQIVDSDGNRIETDITIGSDCWIYEFGTTAGKDMAIGYRTVHIDYVPEDLPDADVEIRNDAVELIDLSNGDPRCNAWHGWRETTADAVVGKSIDRANIIELGLDTLRLDQECEAVTLHVQFSNSSIPESELTNDHTGWYMKGTDKFPSVPNTEHYRCIGWTKSVDGNSTVYPIGSELRIYRNSAITAVWEPFEQYRYAVEYTNIDGSSLEEPVSYGHGMTVTIGDQVPSDKPTYQIFDGWRIGDSEILYRSGDTFIAEGPVKLVPVLEESRKIPLIIDGETIGEIDSRMGSETTIEVDDPVDPDRFFAGWIWNGTDPLFKGDSAILDDTESLVASWKDKKTYTITYLDDDETAVISSCTVKERDEIAIHADAAREGSVLKGWNDGSEVIPDGERVVVCRSYTLIAVWEVAGDSTPQHKLSYFGFDEETISYDHGTEATVSFTPDPRSGSVFKGWSTTPENTDLILIGSKITMNADITLYPCWEDLPRYRLTYHIDEDESETVYAYRGDRVALMDLSGRTDSEFMGWSETADGMAKPAGTEIIMDADIDLYPIWKKDGTFTVTYHASGEERSIPVKSGETYVVSFTPTGKRGYTFGGWSETSDGAKKYSNGDGIVIERNLDLYPVWNPLKLCKITFMTDPTTRTEAFEGEDYRIDCAPEKVGYELIGWSLKKNGSADYAADGTISIEDDIELYPVWKEAKSYDIEFRLENGTVKTKVYEGQSIALTCNDAERSGFELVGWSKTYGGDKEYDVGERITPRASMALYPVWKAIPVYTVTYHGISVAPVSVLQGEVITLLDGPAGDASEFRGWTTREGGSVEYKAGGKMSVYSDTDLYPVWGDEPVFVITYHCENGIFTSSHGKGDLATLAGTQTRDGFVFAGWSLSSGGPVEYLAGTSVSIDSDMDLYPVWTPVAADDPSEPADDGDDEPSADRTDGGSGSDGINLVSVSAIAGVVVAVVAMMAVILRRS